MLKVSSKTEPKKLAGAILHAMRENSGTVDLLTIGAGAVNQAVKAIAIANRISSEKSGRKVRAVPGFKDMEMQDGRQVTAIKFTVLAS